MKYYLPLIALFLSINAVGQVKVTIGQNSPEFVTQKQTSFTSYSTADIDYFMISRLNSFQKIHTMLTVDKTGTIITSKDVTVDMGLWNNRFDVLDLVVVGNKSLIIFQNQIKASLKNQLVAKAVDVNGNIAADGTNLASIDFLKMSKGGKWYISVTPDKKHMAVIGLNPHIKETSDLVNYYIFDENLKETRKGQFSFAGYTKELSFETFQVSDKGDLYMTDKEYEKTYSYPMLYKFSVEGTSTIIPVMITDPTLKNLSYTSDLSPEGDLIIAGYTQKKANFTAGDIANNGTWLFNSAKPTEVKTFKSETGFASIVARKIIQNGDTFYLVGEQYKQEEIKAIKTSAPYQFNDPTYKYIHGDIIVNAYSQDGSIKFEIPISRKMISNDSDPNLMVGTGVINNKLAVIYNDQYNKYFEDKLHVYSYLKVPVAVLVTNDGLMEAPIQFAKELDIKNTSTYILLPQYTVSSGGKITVLSANSKAVNTMTFSK